MKKNNQEKQQVGRERGCNLFMELELSEKLRNELLEVTEAELEAVCGGPGDGSVGTGGGGGGTHSILVFKSVPESRKKEEILIALD